MKKLKSFELFLNEIIQVFQEAEKSNAKALYIGINYENSRYELRGCINDAQNLQNFFESEFNIKDFQMLTDHTEKKPTKSNILEEIEHLLETAQVGDHLIITYSGHGVQKPDYDDDEKDYLDECLFTLDQKRITDDTLYDLLRKHLKDGVSVFFLMDCCHSASNVDLEYVLDLDGVSTSVHSEESSIPNGKIISISGSADNNYSYETLINGQIQGALSTQFVLRMLELQKNPLLSDKDSSKWTILLNKLYDNLTNKTYPQEPHLSSNKSIEEIPFSSIFKSL